MKVDIGLEDAMHSFTSYSDRSTPTSCIGFSWVYIAGKSMQVHHKQRRWARIDDDLARGSDESGAESVSCLFSEVK